MEAGTIYIATNKTNGKIYVGQTRNSFAKRQKHHVRGQHLFGKACRKYGIDGFTWQQILYHKDELNYWEQYFIEKLNSMHPNGYNLTGGGDNGARSELHKANIGIANSKPKKEEGRANIAAANADPERLARASERMKADPISKRPEVAAKISAASKKNADLGIGNVDYFRTHLFPQLPGEDNPNWSGDRRQVICANPACGKEFKTRPNNVDRKYCSNKCANIVTLGNVNSQPFTDTHLANITTSQRLRRQKEGNRRHMICANPNCKKAFETRPKSDRIYCCRTCYLSTHLFGKRKASTPNQQLTAFGGM